MSFADVLGFKSSVFCLLSSVAGAPEAAVAAGADTKFAPIFLREAAHNQVGRGVGGRKVGVWGVCGCGCGCGCVCGCVCACVVRGQESLKSWKKIAARIVLDLFDSIRLDSKD